MRSTTNYFRRATMPAKDGSPVEVVILDGAELVGNPEQMLQELISAQSAHNKAAVECAELDSVESFSKRMDRAALGGKANRDKKDTFGGMSFAEACARARDGWIDGGRRATDFVDEVTNEVEAELRIVPSRRRRRWSDDGDEFCTQRMLAGDVDTAWRSSRRDRRSFAPIVSVVIPWGGNYRMPTEHLFWRGATGVAIANSLELMGYHVEIIAASRNSHRDPDGRGAETMKMVRVKESDRPLRVESVASIVCDSAVYRIFGWAAVLACESKVLPGLGRHIHLAADLDLFNDGGPLNLEGEVVIIGEVTNQTDAKSEVERVLRDHMEASDAPDEELVEEFQ